MRDPYTPLSVSLFVDSNKTFTSIVKLVAEASGGLVNSRAGDAIESNVCQYGIANNDEYSWWRSCVSGDSSFLFYRYRIDINPSTMITSEVKYLQEINSVIKMLREHRARVVAAGEMEGKLD